MVLLTEEVFIMTANEKTNTEKMKEKFEEKELDVDQMEGVTGGYYQEMIMDSSAVMGAAIRERTKESWKAFRPL